MTRSFRLRIALLSALLSGLVLIAFGAGTWWLVRSIKLERIDSEVRTWAEREANRMGEVQDWQRPLGRMTTALGVKDINDIVLLVQDDDGETLYRSSHWPAGLTSESLPWPVPGAGPAADAGWQLFSSAHAQGPPGAPQFRPGMGVPDEERRRRMEQRQRARDLQGGGGAPSAPLPPLLAGSDSEPPPPPTAELGDRPPAGAGSTLPVPEPTGLRNRRRLPPASTSLVLPGVGAQWRVGLAVTEAGRVAVAVNARVIDDDMASMRNAFLFALPFALVLIGLGSFVVASRTLRPLNKLTRAARKVTAEGLDQRIDGKDEDEEFGELIDVFNRMLERLERSFKQAQRFSADAAHELKTPLAILQGQLERAIQNAEDGSPLQAQLSGILDEVRRLSGISRKLLLLSQADAGQMKLLRERFDLSAALEELVEDTRMLAPTLKVDGQVAAGVVIEADGAMLRQVLHNLISNAIKYNVPEGWIRISLTAWAQRVEVKIANASAGIAPAQRKKLFERFYRADAAHSRMVEGVGLGLALSREIARAHGGDITLAAADFSHVEFSLVLPATARHGI